MLYLIYEADDFHSPFPFKLQNIQAQSYKGKKSSKLNWLEATFSCRALKWTIKVMQENVVK